MDQPEIKILSCRGISLFAEGRSMLNTRRIRMPKRKNDTRTGADDARAVGRSVCQEISDTVFADTRNASLVTTIDVRHKDEFSPDFSRRKYGELHMCDTTNDTLASLERGKFTVLAIKSSLSHYVDP